MSAAVAGSYSLSANQIGFPFSIFAIHKEIPYGKWFVDEVANNNNYMYSEETKEEKQIE